VQGQGFPVVFGASHFTLQLNRHDARATCSMAGVGDVEYNAGQGPHDLSRSATEGGRRVVGTQGSADAGLLHRQDDLEKIGRVHPRGIETIGTLPPQLRQSLRPVVDALRVYRDS
jgi:hypothetical protein